MKDSILRFIRDEQGVTAVEYGIIAGLIAAVLIGTIDTIGDRLLIAFTAIKDKLPSAAPAS